MVVVVNVCLMPITNPGVANRAIKSAESDGWKVITLEDKNKEGASVTREKLLNIALKENVDIIRYLDDDDTLLPHLKNIDFGDEDIIYTDNYCNDYLNKLSGNPKVDILKISPWSWIAKASSLKKIKDLQGYVWDKSILHVEGYWCWYGFLKYNLKFKYLPITAYQYNKVSYRSQSNNKNHEIYILYNKLKEELFEKVKYVSQ